MNSRLFLPLIALLTLAALIWTVTFGTNASAKPELVPTEPIIEHPESNPAPIERRVVPIPAPRLVGPVEVSVRTFALGSKGVKTALPDAVLEVTTWDEKNGKPAFESVSMDRDGQARVVLRNAVALKARARGHMGAAVYLRDLQPGTIELVLEAYGSFELSLVSPSGGPRPGANVSFGYAQDGAQNKFKNALDLLSEQERPAFDHVTVESDGAGMCRIRPVLPGIPLAIQVIDRVYGRTVRHLPALEAGEQRSIRLQLKSGGAARIEIQDHLRQPLPGALVSCFLIRGIDQRVVAKSVTGVDGVAVLTGLKEGQHRMVVTGWNASSSDLYLVDRDFEVQLDASLDLGTLVASGPHADLRLTLNELGEGSRLGRAFFSPSRKRPGFEKGGGQSTFVCQLPVGRSVRIWTGAADNYKCSIQITEVSRETIDSKIRGKDVVLAVPGNHTLEFLRHEQPTTRTATFAFQLPEIPNDKPSHTGFFALVRGNTIVSMLGGITPTHRGQLVLTSPFGGEHQLIGCVGTQAVRRPVFLKSGELIRIGAVETLAPAVCELEARWPDGSTVRKAELIFDLGGASSGRKGRNAIESKSENGKWHLHLPPDILGYIRITAGSRRAGADFRVGNTGNHRAVLRLRRLE